MQGKNIGQILGIILGVIVAIYAVVAIILNPTGGISGLSKLITILGVIIGIINPKAGLYFLVVQAVYCDEVKRVGVYYGVQSTQTVSEILIGPLLTLCALNISFLHGILRRQYKIDLLGWVLYALTPIVAAILLIKGRGDGLVLNIYLAGTTSAYLTLIPICYGVFNTFQDWVKLVSSQVIVAAPAAAWGIWQYFNGFNQIEWGYALSGLSRVHSVQMMMEEPRIFGLFGSASALGCVGMYGIFSFWRGAHYRKGRWGYMLLALVYFVVTVLSHQRSLLLFPIIVLVFSLAFRRKVTTILLYGSAFLVLVLGILNATYLREEGIEKIDGLIIGESRWSRNVMSVSTFSDRLMGWERLTRPETWSLFGTEKELTSSIVKSSINPDYQSSDYSHDIINRILINFGAVGLCATLLLAGIILYQLHNVIFRCKTSEQRKEGAFVMACIVPVLILSFMGGDNFSTTPINLQTWSIFAGIFVLKRTSMNSSPPPTQRVPYPSRGNPTPALAS